MIDQIADARTRDPDKPERLLTPEELKEKSRGQYIIDIAHLEIWIAWQSFKAPDGGLTFTEVLQMPAGMRHDFNLFESLLADATKARRRKMRKPAKPARRKR